MSDEQELPQPQKTSDEPVNYTKKIYHLLVGIVLVIVAINIIVLGGLAHFYALGSFNCFIQAMDRGENTFQAYADCPLRM